MDKNDKNFIIISSDNKEFKVNKTIINYSQKLKDLLFEQSGPDNYNKIEIDFIESTTLSHIITLIKFNISNKNNQIFNINFIKNLDIDCLLDIILASKYLQIEFIYKLSSDRLKLVIKKPPSEIRQIFNIDYDL
jgi:hypothetical protein